jgi:hypothetical protein
MIVTRFAFLNRFHYVSVISPIIFDSHGKLVKNGGTVPNKKLTKDFK